MTADKQPPALACHLDGSYYQERVRRFAALNGKFLLECRRQDLGLEMVYSPNATAEVRELVRLEEECCPFLCFQLEPGESWIKLSITAPESTRDFLDTLLQPFRTI